MDARAGTASCTPRASLLLADTAAGYASFAHLPEGAKNFTTVELKSNFLGTVREGTIRTECRCRAPRADDAGVVVRRVRLRPFRIALFRCTQLVLW